MIETLLTFYIFAGGIIALGLIVLYTAIRYPRVFDRIGETYLKK